MKKSIQSALAKYFVISGRAGRPEFWWWNLFYITLLVVLVRLDMRFDALIFAGVAHLPPVPLATMAALLLAPAHVAVSARRLHDVGCSAWMLTVGLIPLIGWVVLLWFFCKPSVGAVNRHGRPPEGIPYF